MFSHRKVQPSKFAERGLGPDVILTRCRLLVFEDLPHPLALIAGLRGPSTFTRSGNAPEPRDTFSVPAIGVVLSNSRNPKILSPVIQPVSVDVVHDETSGSSDNEPVHVDRLLVDARRRVATASEGPGPLSQFRIDVVINDCEIEPIAQLKKANR